jgi:hypothetical protein
MAAVIVVELRRQHAALRARLEACDLALDAALAGDGDAAALTAAIHELAAALAAHHGFEEAHLALFDSSAGDPRHVEHHAALALGLDDPSVRALAQTLRELRRHLAREDELLDGLP